MLIPIRTSLLPARLEERIRSMKGWLQRSGSVHNIYRLEGAGPGKRATDALNGVDTLRGAFDGWFSQQEPA